MTPKLANQVAKAARFAPTMASAGFTHVEAADLDDAGWLAVAVALGENVPSGTTRALIVAQLTPAPAPINDVFAGLS